MFAICWDDLYPPTGNGVWYYYDTLGHRFIVEFDSVHYYSPAEQWDKHEIVIYDTTVQTSTGDNVVLFQFLTANNYTSSTTGLEDPSSTIGINYLANGSYHRGAAPLIPGMAIKWTTNPPQVRVGVSDAAGATRLPVRLELLGSAPNPFRGRTRVSYVVPVETRLRLGVFDASGRKVAELFNGLARPGFHSVVWNGQDSQGRTVAHGVYFYRLETDRTRLIKKTVLLK